MKKRASNKNLRDSWLLASSMIAVLVLLLISLRYDFQISLFIVSLSSSWLTWSMLWLTYLGTPLIAFLSAGIVYLTQKDKKDMNKVMRLWIALIATMIIDVALKIAIARPRPFTYGISVANATYGLIQKSYSTWDFSFPSSHAATAFAVLIFLPKKWRIPWLILAVLISFSRVYLGLHYLSDTIAGAALGLAVAYIINSKLGKRKNPLFGKK